MDNTPDLIYFKDAQSRFTRVNRAQAAALSLSNPEAVVGRSELELLPTELARAAVEDERRLMRTGEALIGHLESAPAIGRGWSVWVPSGGALMNFVRQQGFRHASSDACVYPYPSPDVAAPWFAGPRGPEATGSRSARARSTVAQLSSS